MEEEVSTAIRIGVLFVMIASFLTVCLNVAIMSTAIVTNEANRYGDARVSSGSSSIIQLQDFPRNYFDLVRIKHEQEELVNSIILESADGTEKYLLFVRSSAIVTNDHTKDALEEMGFSMTTILNEDYIDSNLDSFMHDKLVELREKGTRIFIHVYPCKDGFSFDIYGELEN